MGEGFAADAIFPVLPVLKESDSYHTYSRDAIDDTVETVRADGDEANEIDWSTSSATYTAEEHSLKHLVTDRVVANADKPIVPKMRATELLIDKIRLGIEKRVRDLVQATGSITNATPTVKWDASSGTITIEKDIDTGKEAVALACGFEPNVMVVPPAVAKVMKRDSTIRDLIRYTQSDLLVNGDLPPTMFNLRVVIPGAQVNSANAGVTQSVARIWSSDKVVLAYVNPRPTQNTMAAGIQFRVRQGGRLDFVVTEYRVSGRKGQMVEVSVIQDEKRVCTDALYIINDVLT